MSKLYAFPFAVLLCAILSISGASAQTEPEEKVKVFIIGADGDNPQVKAFAIDSYRSTLRKGHQQSGMPRFLITNKNAKAVFTIGGFVNFRTAYDFNNVIDNKDFVTYQIPMSVTPSDKQRFLMDPTTSRLFFKTIIDAGKFGPIEGYIETDFRGDKGVLRLREAYISFKGFLFGQAATTFCDLEASPNTIDFEGPNAYTYGRNAMIRYSHKWGKHWSAAIAIEMPSISATTGNHAYTIPQRVPDIPIYAQYSWNEGASHVRASGIFRTLYYRDEVQNDTRAEFGWGVQLSSVYKICPKLTAYGQLVYGEGITPYIQDLNGNGLDMVPNPRHSGQLQTFPMMAWLVGAQYSLTKKAALSVGYSQVNLWNKNGYFNPDQYRYSQYVVANVFYNITSYLKAGVEYLYGTRHDMNHVFGHANRAQAMVQLNF